MPVTTGAGVTYGAGVTVGPTQSQLLSPFFLLDAGDSASYPGTGRNVYDVSGNNRGSWYQWGNLPFFTTLGGIKTFNTTGTGDLSGGAQQFLNKSVGFTWMSWARLVSSNLSQPRALFGWDDSTWGRFLWLQPNSYIVGMYYANSFTSSGADVSAYVDTWAQWTVTVLNNTQTYYVNGTQVGTTSNSSALNTGASKTTAWAGYDPFGYVANTYTFSSALSQSQVNQYYQSLRSGFGV